MSVTEAAKAVALALGSQKYAVVGGAACAMLGSLRVTRDVDIVVPRGQTVQARALLRQSSSSSSSSSSSGGHFVIDPKTAHTFHGSIAIEILTPPVLFREVFDESTQTVVVDGVHILPPFLMLNAKCGSLPSRATESKKASDATDIKFLLGWIATNGLQVSTEGVLPNINDTFYRWFVEQYGEPELWTHAGYDIHKGLCSITVRSLQLM